MKKHPIKVTALLFQYIGGMPGDGFPLAIRVRGQIYVMGVSGSLLQTLYNFLLARDILVLGFKTIFHVNAISLLGRSLMCPTVAAT